MSLKKVKCFEKVAVGDNIECLEQAINEWLEKNATMITNVQVTQSSSEKLHLVMICYDYYNSP